MIAFLYAVAIVFLTIYGGNLLWLSIEHVRHTELQEGPVPDPNRVPVPDDSWPTVTVQLPIYNEADVVDRLIDACARLDYPTDRLEIQVLDDSTDETTKRAAERVAHWQEQGIDIVHIHRSDRTGYKAGALQNGLRIARGELIAIFDADFVPPEDFLRRMVPPFLEDDNLGLAQARWGHINQDVSLLTKVQAFGLDTHFAIEQHARKQMDCFMNFNGTAGVWRRACIEDAGGWEYDTVTEDLDLSYRAQLSGWTFRFFPFVEAPAELPPDMNALRTQQFRWAKGAIETSMKLLRRIWTSTEPFRIKLQGTLHLTGHTAFPFILLAAITHAPLLGLDHLGYGPGPWYFGALGVGLLGFAGFGLAQCYAQRSLYPDWGRRLVLLPVYMAGSMGIALSNTHAFLQALWGTPTPFTRTPKFGSKADEGSWWTGRYASARVPWIVWGEAFLAFYCLVGLGFIIAFGDWAAVPFQALFAGGFGLVAWSGLKQALRVRHTPTAA